MGINWLVRFKNKAFWMALIPSLFILAQAILQIVGIDFDFTELSMRITGAVEALFVVLAIIGVVADPTTKGIRDSKTAMGYSEPKPYEDETANVRIEGTD